MGYKQWSLEGEISKPNAMYHHPQVITILKWVVKRIHKS